LLRPGELVEVIPGLAATQHSGSGKANQYFLRGFNIDHGTDFSVSLGGTPLNLRTHAHGQGYLDLNLLPPELVGDIVYHKGPYQAQTGDFSAAGSASFRLLDRLDGSFATITGGEHGYARSLVGVELGDGYAAVDMTASDGPWVNPEGLRKATLLLHQRAGDWKIDAIAYGAKWRSTDQVPARAIAEGLISRLGAIDPTDGGRTSRVILSAATERADGLSANLYIQRYELNLWSDFTYRLDDPVNGDQFEQAEHRWVGGGAITKTWSPRTAWSYSAGAETRYDHIGQVGLYHTRARARLSTTRQDQVDQGSLGLWGQADWRTGPLRAGLALRLDAMSAKVRSIDVVNSGERSQALVSPKLTLAWQINDQLEFYADAGRGFHSNDARGATARISPAGDPVRPVDLLVPATGAEIGARFERAGASLSATLWTLDLDSELVYSGDAGDTESTSASRRQGLEILANWTPTPRLNLDLSAAATQARYRAAAGQNRIPNALDYVLTAGATWRMTDHLTGEITFRRLGPAALIEDNSARSRPANVTNLLVRQRWSPIELTGEILNLFNSRDQDISYFYASRLTGEPVSGVEDLHVHPLEPRTARVSLKTRF
jgi:hypothetical protein